MYVRCSRSISLTCTHCIVRNTPKKRKKNEYEKASSIYNFYCISSPLVLFHPPKRAGRVKARKMDGAAAAAATDGKDSKKEQR